MSVPASSPSANLKKKPTKSVAGGDSALGRITHDDSISSSNMTDSRGSGGVIPHRNEQQHLSSPHVASNPTLRRPSAALLASSSSAGATSGVQQWTYQSLHSLRGKDLSTVYLRKCESAGLRASNRILHRLERVDRHTTNIFDLSGIGPASAVSSFEVALETIALAHAIREVSLRSTDATQREIELLAHHVSLNPTVTSLDVSHNPRLDQQAANALCDLAEHKPTLLRVVYDGCDAKFSASKSVAVLERLLERNNRHMTAATSPAATSPMAAMTPTAARPPLSLQRRFSAVADSPMSTSSSSPILPPPIILTRCSSSSAGGSSQLSPAPQRSSVANSGSRPSPRTIPASVASHLQLGHHNGAITSSSPALQLDRYVLAPLHNVLRWVTWEHTTQSMAMVSVSLVIIWTPLLTSVSVVLLLFWFGKRPRDALVKATADAAAEGQHFVDHSATAGSGTSGSSQPMPPPPQHISLRNAIREFMSPYDAALERGGAKGAAALASPAGATDGAVVGDRYRPLHNLRQQIDDIRGRLYQHHHHLHPDAASGVAAGGDDAVMQEAIRLLLNPFHNFICPVIGASDRWHSSSDFVDGGEDDHALAACHDRVFWLLCVLVAVLSLTVALFVGVVHAVHVAMGAEATGGPSSSFVALLLQSLATTAVIVLFSLDVWWGTLVRTYVLEAALLLSPHLSASPTHPPHLGTSLATDNSPTTTTTTAPPPWFRVVAQMGVAAMVAAFRELSQPKPCGPPVGQEGREPAASQLRPQSPPPPRRTTSGIPRRSASWRFGDPQPTSVLGYSAPASSRSSSRSGSPSLQQHQQYSGVVQQSSSSSFVRDDFLDSVRAITRPQPLDERYTISATPPPPPPLQVMEDAAVPTTGGGGGVVLQQHMLHAGSQLGPSNSLNASMHSPLSRSSQHSSGGGGAAGGSTGGGRSPNSATMVPRGRLQLVDPHQASGTASALLEFDPNASLTCHVAAVEVRLRRAVPAAAASSSPLARSYPSSTSLSRMRQQHHISGSPPTTSTMHTVRLQLLMWGVVPCHHTLCFRCDTPNGDGGGGGAACLLWHKADSDAPIALGDFATLVSAGAPGGGHAQRHNEVLGALLDASAVDTGPSGRRRGADGGAQGEEVLASVRIASGSAALKKSLVETVTAHSPQQPSPPAVHVVQLPLVVQRCPTSAASDVVINLERYQPLMDLVKMINVSLSITLTRHTPLSPEFQAPRLLRGMQSPLCGGSTLVSAQDTAAMDSSEVAETYWDIDDGVVARPTPLRTEPTMGSFLPQQQQQQEVQQPVPAGFAVLFRGHLEQQRKKA